ncbi:hypothetical protein FRC97_05895 [Paracidovorax citrulli]|nr:hypothetical protein FRC75_20155 [Paracidovorax citrulli]UMT90834.1 hypothetical protein FRC90_22290 [Paracidovorax citrulli]UMT97628.1 hypothetical protein FRC97_05895 [Paracidovorax citrulli]
MLLQRADRSASAEQADMEQDSDTDSEASFDVVVDDGAIRAARQARMADITQALANTRTPEALNAMVARATEMGWQASQCTLPGGEEVSQALRPTYRHRTDGFMEVKQALRHIEAAANAWEAAAEHQQAALCARELLLPQAGPDLLDQLLWQSQTVARRLRAQEKTLEALLLLRQFPYAGAAGKCRIHDEAAARLREACSLRMNELPAELPAAVADIDAALHRELADISPRMAGLLDAIGPDGKLPGVPSRMPPPGSDARQAEAIEEAWLATYAHSCAALEDAARALLARSHPSEISSPAAAVKAGALTHPEAREGRATLRRNAALHKTMAPLLAGLQPPPDGAATRRKAGQGAPPQAPWLHALEAFGEWNLVLQRVENARRTLQAHSASWSPAQREASRDAIDSVQARLAAAQANASEQGREALVQSLAHLARQGIHASQEMPGSDPSAARHALAGAAEAARHAREALERSGLHARMAPVCTAIAQACEAMAHVPRTAAEARDHAARLQAAERQARAAAWEELAPDMHRLADLCGTACEGALRGAAEMEAQVADQARAQREGALQAAMEAALEQPPRPAEGVDDGRNRPPMPWQRPGDVVAALHQGLQAAQQAQSTLEEHLAGWTVAQRQESGEAVGALRARLDTARAAALENAISALQQSFKEIWRAAAPLLSADTEERSLPSGARSLAGKALAAAGEFHRTLHGIDGQELPERARIASIARAFAPLSTTSDALRMPLDTSAQAMARADVLDTAARQAREAAHSDFKVPLQHWARWCDGLRTDAISFALLHGMKAIDFLCKASEADLNAATSQLSDRMLTIHELAFDLPLHFTADGSIATSTQASPPPVVPSEDLEMARCTAAIAQRAAELRASLLPVPPGTLPEMAQDYQASRNSLSETAYAARVTSGLLPLFHEASQAIAQAPADQQPRVARQFARKALTYQQDAANALGDYLESSMRLSSRSARRAAMIDGANLRQSERLVTLMQRSLDGLGHLLECRSIAIGVHARAAIRHRDVRDGLMTIADRYERATQKIQDSLEHMEQRLEAESRLPGYADIAQGEKANMAGAFGMLIWRGKFESTIVQAMLAADWLARFLGPDLPLRTASDLSACTELIQFLQGDLSAQNQFALRQLRDDGNAHLVRKMLKVSLECIQRLKAFQEAIAAREQAPAAAAATGSSSTAPAPGPAKTRQRRGR